MFHSINYLLCDVRHRDRRAVVYSARPNELPEQLQVTVLDKTFVDIFPYIWLVNSYKLVVIMDNRTHGSTSIPSRLENRDVSFHVGMAATKAVAATAFYALEGALQPIEPGLGSRNCLRSQHFLYKFPLKFAH